MCLYMAFCNHENSGIKRNGSKSTYYMLIVEPPVNKLIGCYFLIIIII